MAEYLVRLEDKTPKILKDQITANKPYRYRFEGIVRAVFHGKIIKISIQGHTISLENHDTQHWAGSALMVP